MIAPISCPPGKSDSARAARSRRRRHIDAPKASWDDPDRIIVGRDFISALAEAIPWHGRAV
jgi:hypothetical protein